MSGSGQLLFTAGELATAIASTDPPVVIDCRFDLMNPAAGRETWDKGHIPGAFYADLDQDLAAPRTSTSGRHPLPAADDLATRLGSWGLTPDRWLIAYDNVGGAIAARLWWLARWAGHGNVALLDGGLSAWEAAGYELTAEHPTLQAGRYPMQGGQLPTISVAELVTRMSAGDLTLLDARDPVRFAGSAEPIDPVAGHVPGALNRPFNRNLDEQGFFRDPAELAAEFTELLDGHPADVASMCGSGVTACHNLFAMALAERPVAKLYVGSWSEWVRDPARPVSSGSAPH